MWTRLEEISQLDIIAKDSFENPIVIFKHSTRCFISKSALRRFEHEYNSDNEMGLYFLDLLEYRVISNEIAQRFGVVHQSPQIIIVRNGKAIYNASHESIDAGKLEEFE